MRWTKLKALIGARIYTGTRFFEDHALVFEDGKVVRVMAEPDVPAGADTCRLDGGLLAPGFVDLQVNGGGGVLFNDDTTAAGIRAIGAAHRRFGTTAFLPTLITDRPGKVSDGFLALEDVQRDAEDARDARVLGIHFEGPFLNPARRGVHDAAHIRPISEGDIADLCTRTGEGVRTLVTLAPECVPPGTIRRLSEAGLTVFAGHTEATPVEIAKAEEEGLAGFTHLFNAMPPLAGRAPGPVGACLASQHSRCTLIVDGIHIDPVSAKLVLACKDKTAVILISDAMPPVGANDPRYTLYGETITAIDGRCATAEGTLAGSALDMATAVRNAVNLLGVDLADALAMASLNPAQVLQLDHLYGRLEPGYCADIVWLDDDLQVRATWVEGIRS